MMVLKQVAVDQTQVFQLTESDAAQLGVQQDQPHLEEFSHSCALFEQSSVQAVCIAKYGE